MTRDKKSASAEAGVETIVWPHGPDGTPADEHLTAAVAVLADGGLVALPTETVYGLAGDATRAETAAAIFAAKGRPSFNPLISHVPDLEAVERHGFLTGEARQLAERFWPGPMTLVLRKRPDSPIADLTTSGLDSVALRVPAHPVFQRLSQMFGKPLAAPSANRSGRISPTCAAHVYEELSGRINGILDGGPTEVGLESTVIACLDDQPVLLRPGGIAHADVEACLGRTLARADAEDQTRPQSPGMLLSHYAPDAAVRLNATHVEPGEAWLGFGGDRPAGAETARAGLDLSPSGDLFEAAANLFGALRSLDGQTETGIAVVAIPEDGLGEAINDRLRRAAAPRG
ncbi:L-threonylcarbamoyladenylate synthase [Coralliovum pocilloporae]|uniref:L-threonylcarbamoyladenylate synthase n=1 Tax=Coralliovum pocilloporae TaxID=3066369 RepID=UPI003306EF55